MNRSLRLPPRRSDKTEWFWRILPFLAGALVLVVIWAERRGRRSATGLGTAPAGARPMPEREVVHPTVGVAPVREQPAPFATSGTTAAAPPEAGSAIPTAADQPAPVTETGVMGTVSAESPVAAGPHLADRHENQAGDAGSSNKAALETPGESSTSVAEAVDTIPTPAEATTAVPQKEGEGWIAGDGTSSCPPEFPIKGNAKSRIYHLPGEASYEATIPEICFANEEAAAEHGYRPRKR